MNALANPLTADIREKKMKELYGARYGVEAANNIPKRSIYYQGTI
jgi:hypothetical protein